MLSTGETYRDLGADFLARRNPQQAARRLIAQLERLGHTVTIQEAAAGYHNGFALQLHLRAIALDFSPRNRRDSRARPLSEE